MRRVGLQGMVRTRVKGGARINVRNGDGGGDSLPAEKESEKDDGNRW